MKTAKQKHYVCNLEITFSKKASHSTPVRMHVDFSSITKEDLAGRLIDPHTIRIKRKLGKKTKLLKTPDGPVSICHHESQVAVADVNGDGIDEVIIGGESGTIYTFHRDWLNCAEHRIKFL